LPLPSLAKVTGIHLPVDGIAGILKVSITVAPAVSEHKATYQLLATIAAEFLIQKDNF
jgi:hypothetical protein